MSTRTLLALLVVASAALSSAGCDGVAGRAGGDPGTDPGASMSDGGTTSGDQDGGTVLSSGGGTMNGCPGYAAPTETACCMGCGTHACQTNGCYGGWYCDTTACKCKAPPTGCSSSGGGGDGGVPTGGGVDSGVPTGGGTSGPVGPMGGTVNLLHFGVSGDTRPPSCEDTAGYPTSVITSIAQAEAKAGAQFAIDLGDHMYVCNNSLSTAQAQMNLFTSATQKFGGTWFMTMGNHECWQGPCLLSSQNANYVAFMQALAPISSRPYYSWNVETSLGRATFVTIADNAWDSNQASWLQTTLADADQHAKYTIVMRHHPEGDTSVTTNADSMAIIRQHKFALFLTGHSHLYKHMTTDSGRDMVLGCSGAPLIAGGSFFGYAMIDQKTSGQLTVTVYDVSTGQTVDSWSVGPNQ